MSKKRKLYVVVSVLIILLTTFFFVIKENSTEANTIDINLYFLNETEDTIIEEPRKIKYTNDKNLTSSVLNELKIGPKNQKNKPIFEDNVSINNIVRNNMDITVDLSKEFKKANNTKKLHTTYAIVKSLCQLPKVDTVLVTCDKGSITLSDGTVIGPLSDKDIDLVTDSITKDSKRIVLYFSDKNGDCLLAENRTIKITDTNPIELYIVNELIKGTQSSETKSIIAPDTELISAQTTDTVCFVNFKSGFIEKNSGDEKKEKLIIYSIVNSLCDVDGIDSVQFLIDGKKAEKFGSFDISNALTADKNIAK